MSSKNKPLVSIIVPIYNSDRYLSECLNSVFSQSYKNIEVVLVNDGSTDNSAHIIADYANKHHDAIVINKKNGGLPDARNAGIKKASGDFFCFVDSDDIISTTFVEKLLHAIDMEKGIYISCCRYNRRASNYLNAQDNIPIQTISSPDYLIKTYYQNDASLYSVTVGTKMFAANLFRKVKFPIGKLYEDFAIIDQLILQSPKISLVGENLYYYRRTSNSITTEKFNDQHLNMIEHCNDLIKKYHNATEIHDALLVMKYTRCIEILTKIKSSKKYNKTITRKIWEFIKEYRAQILTNQNARLSIRASAIISLAGPSLLISINSFRKRLEQ